MAGCWVSSSEREHISTPHVLLELFSIFRFRPHQIYKVDWALKNKWFTLLDFFTLPTYKETMCRRSRNDVDGRSIDDCSTDYTYRHVAWLMAFCIVTRESGNLQNTRDKLYQINGYSSFNFFLNRGGLWGTARDFTTGFHPYLCSPLLPHVVFPILFLSASLSSPFHCALQDDLG